MFIFYIYWLISPILWVAISILSIFNSKIRHHWFHQYSSIKNAQSILNQKKNTKDVVLFHAASTGEFEQLKPILKKINRSKYFILITFFSPTIFKIENKTNLADAVCYHPFDLPWSAFIFFKKLNIKYYIITRNDLWPNHLLIAKNIGVKTVLINANLYRSSDYKKWPNNLIMRLIFSYIDLILTGSYRLQKNLSKITSKDKIIVTGDSRIDQVLERKNLNNKNLLPDVFKNSKNIILGSIIPSDYNIIFNSFKEFYHQGDKSIQEKNHRIIIVPHEIIASELLKIESKLDNIGLSFSYYSKQNQLINPKVIIIDKIGILADLYKYSDLAYIGAGFSTGIHSIIEPAIYNNIVSFGPNYSIVDMAVDLIEKKISKLINNQTDFISTLEILDNDDQLNLKKIEMKKFISKQTLASDNIIKSIFDYA